MARKEEEPWQPMLLDVTPKKEPRIEYEEPTVRVRKKGLPSPDGEPGEAPWWARARQAEQSAPATVPQQASWSAEWHKLLRLEGWTAELPAGKRTELERAVRSLDVRPGVLEASVGVGATRPDRVQIRWNPVGMAEWTRLARHVLNRKTDSAVLEGLGRGEIPIPFVDAADANKTPLLPRRLAYLSAACTCGGAALPCDHVLSTHLVVARRLAREPLLLLLLRGIARDELTALLDRVRVEAAGGAGALPNSPAAGDPYRRPEAAEPDWARLDRLPPARQPLPLPEAWRVGESFDALVRRLIAGARTRQEELWRRARSP